MPPIPAVKSLFMIGCKGKALHYSTKKLLLWGTLRAKEANLKLQLWFFSLGVATCGWHEGGWHGSILGVTPQVGEAASHEVWIEKSKFAKISWTTIHAQPSLSMGKQDSIHLKAQRFSSKPEGWQLTTDLSKSALQLTGFSCAKESYSGHKEWHFNTEWMQKIKSCMCPNSLKVFTYKHRAVSFKSTCMESCNQPLTICTSHSVKAKLVQHLEMHPESFGQFCWN